MNTHTHTPSPWSFKTSNECRGIPCEWEIEDQHGGVIAITNSGTSNADARLIASAPDLLAALKDAEALLFLLGKEHEETGGIDYNADFIAGTRNELLLSIAKAEGRDS
jgi:hypothetical protein